MRSSKISYGRLAWIRILKTSLLSVTYGLVATVPVVARGIACKDVIYEYLDYIRA